MKVSTASSYTTSIRLVLTPIIAAVKNPTNPDSAVESSASSTHLESTLMPPAQQVQNQLLTAAGALTPNPASSSNSMLTSGGYGESNYEVFDPLNWMLDGLVDFPYSYSSVQGLEANGM